MKVSKHLRYILYLSVLSLVINSTSFGRPSKKAQSKSPKIDQKRILVPKSTLMPEYPQAAYEANVGAEVWTKFKIDSSNFIHAVEIISCSVDSFGFESAAIKWMETGEFHFTSRDEVRADDWWFAKLVFIPENWELQQSRKSDSTSPDSKQTLTKRMPIDTTMAWAETMPELIYKYVPRYPRKALLSGQT